MRGWCSTTAARRSGTTPLDAVPDIILKMPEDSYAPLILALAATVAVRRASPAHWWWLAALAALGAGADIIGWLWPEAALGETAEPATDG